MAKQVAKSSMLSKISNKIKRPHEDVEVKLPGGGSLPPGIEQGIAKLVDCRFGQYEKGEQKGEYFFLAAGVVVNPDAHNGIPIKGMRTQIMEPMCDTPTRSRPTIDDHVDWVINQLGMLMGKKPGEKIGIGVDDLESTAQAIKEAAPYFRFRTWQGEPTPQYPNPRTNEVWSGQCEYGEEEVADDVEDDTANEPEADEPEAEAGEAEADNEPEADDVPFGDDLDDLVADASSKDKVAKGKATRELEKRAIAAGHTAEDVDGADNWEAVAVWIREGAAPSAEDEPTPPKVKDVYYYAPAGSKKRIEVEVVSVSTKNETATVQDGDTKKPILGKDKKPLAIAWSDLEND